MVRKDKDELYIILLTAFVILIYFVHGIFSYGCAEKPVCRRVCAPSDYECKTVCKSADDWN